MAKGEGGEQYSNASLLSKPVDLDAIQLAKKVSWLIYGKFLLFCFISVEIQGHLVSIGKCIVHFSLNVVSKKKLLNEWSTPVKLH